jgi:ligand-binding SRPBCC domain-containing protein
LGGEACPEGVAGPYRLWHHTHTFEDLPGGTRMRDVVRYRLPLGPLGRLVHALWVRRTLRRIFDYREQALLDVFGPGPA